MHKWVVWWVEGDANIYCTTPQTDSPWLLNFSCMHREDPGTKIMTANLIKIHTSAMTSPGMEFSSMVTEYSLRSRAGTTSLTSLTVISTVAVALNALGLPVSS